MIRLQDCDSLRCPSTGKALQFEGRLRKQFLDDGHLSAQDGPRWSVQEGLPILVDENAVQKEDRLMRGMYNSFAGVHDLAVKYFLPIQQFASEHATREAYSGELQLDRFSTQRRRPVKILEVGIGTGANIPLILSHLPEHLCYEYWGMDLSLGMIHRCIRRVHEAGTRNMRLLIANAHRLPFPDNSFDRVFHVGGINGFCDPAQAIAEMRRVSLPRCPVVIVDEQLDQNITGLYQTTMFKLLTSYDARPEAPIDCLPEGVKNVKVKQITDFYYCLSFTA
jgi:ubiquinone/menaquinone biosynthesis C-methylase UbiE